MNTESALAAAREFVAMWPPPKRAERPTQRLVDEFETYVRPGRAVLFLTRSNAALAVRDAESLTIYHDAWKQMWSKMRFAVEDAARDSGLAVEVVSDERVLITIDPRAEYDVACALLDGQPWTTPGVYVDADEEAGTVALRWGGPALITHEREVGRLVEHVWPDNALWRSLRHAVLEEAQRRGVPVEAPRGELRVDAGVVGAPAEGEERGGAPPRQP